MTPFLWILAGGFILGIVLLFIFNAAKKPVGMLVGILLSLACVVFFVVNITVEPVKNPQRLQKTATNSRTLSGNNCRRSSWKRPGKNWNTSLSTAVNGVRAGSTKPRTTLTVST